MKLKNLMIMSAGIGMGMYAYKKRYKIKKIMADMKEIMKDEKYMLKDMV